MHRIKSLLKVFFFIITFPFLLSSCASLEKHNLEVEELHSPESLRKDVDYVYAKLQRLHPRLYQFISIEELDKKFDSLKISIASPMTSKDFYYQLAPVVAEIRQGHLSMSFPEKRYTKKEKKALKKLKIGFNDLDFEYLDNALWVSNTMGQDSSLVGSQVLAVNGENSKDLMARYKKTFSSDGYNTTFQDRYIALRFLRLYRKHQGYLDSVSLKLKKGDSVFVKQYKRYLKDSSAFKKKETNDLAKTKNIKPSKGEKEIAKLKRKLARKYNKKHGYIESRKQYTRNLKFLDSSKNIAYFKIRSWTNGNYKKFYKESFAKIDAAKSEVLILDLRNNTGGRLAEIREFYSYLVDEKVQFVKNAETKTRLPFLKGFYGKNTSVLSIVAQSIATPLLFVHNVAKSRKENGVLYFNYPYSKSKNPKDVNFKGKIYVLINGTSFSASSIISSNLHGSKRAIFVGEETGGAYNGTVAGHYKSIETPNAKIGMHIGLMHIQAPYEANLIGYGVRPDIEIIPTAIDRENEVDPELKWVLENIEEQKKKLNLEKVLTSK